MTILENIMAQKQKEVARAIIRKPVKKLEASGLFQRETLSLTDFILSPERTGIIAEFKRKSPSKGIINMHSSIEEVTTGYFRSGASGLSVLTDKEFFGGTAADLSRVRKLVSLPILRKDFIIDEYQIVEAKAIGADAILLIAAVLSVKRLSALARFARSLDLQVLLEIHHSRELEHLNDNVNIVGVNNRDLHTFKVDIETSVQLAHEIPDRFVKISESGISSHLVLKRLKGCGYQGFLIGENFMKTAEPSAAFSEFVRQMISAHD